MTSIVTVTLSPAVDQASEVERIAPGHKLRTSNESFDPGGGGINVARVIIELGGEAEAVCFIGGAQGFLLEELLDRERIPRRLIRSAGQTRISHMVFERQTGLEYRFVPSGPALATEELETCLAVLQQMQFRYLVASGSIPPNTPADILLQIGRLAAEKGAKFVLDSSGRGLSATLGHTAVHLVKPSLSDTEGPPH